MLEELRELEPLEDFFELLEEERELEVRELPDWRERVEELDPLDARDPDERLLDWELLPPEYWLDERSVLLRGGSNCRLLSLRPLYWGTAGVSRRSGVGVTCRSPAPLWLRESRARC